MQKYICVIFGLFSKNKVSEIKLSSSNLCRIPEPFCQQTWVANEHSLVTLLGMGKTCEPKAFSCQCMTEFTTNKNLKKKKKNFSIIFLVDLSLDCFLVSPSIPAIRKTLSKIFLISITLSSAMLALIIPIHMENGFYKRGQKELIFF